MTALVGTIQRLVLTTYSGVLGQLTDQQLPMEFFSFLALLRQVLATVIQDTKTTMCKYSVCSTAW